MLTKKQFDILAALTEKDAPMTLEELAASAGCGVPEAEDILSGLVDKKLLEGRALTAQGYEALEPYRVKRAVFMAAVLRDRIRDLSKLMLEMGGGGEAKWPARKRFASGS